MYIIDADSNNEGRLDANDIQSLYISKIDGSNFNRIITPNQELLEWKIIAEIDRLYIKTIEDTNKNGDFDKEDTIHYMYVDLLDQELKTTEYYPN